MLKSKLVDIRGRTSAVFGNFRVANLVLTGNVASKFVDLGLSNFG